MVMCPSRIAHLLRKSGDTILVFLLSWSAALLGFEDAADKTFQTRQERIVAERSPGTSVPAQRLQLLFRQSTVEKTLPIGNDSQQRRDLHQPVVECAQMRPRAAPRPLRWALHQPRPHGVPFDVPCRRQQVGLVHDKGCETSLPQIAPT